MNKKSNILKTPITSIVGEKISIEGSFTTDEGTRIDGHIKGDIISSSLLILGAGSIVDGNVKAACLVTSGTINGNITTSDRTELLSQAVVKGDITTETLVMDENAVFEGSCTMTGTGE